MKTKMYVLAALLMASMVNIMADDDVKIKQVYPTSGDWAEFVLNGWDSDTKGLYIDKDQCPSCQKSLLNNIFCIYSIDHLIYHLR